MWAAYRLLLDPVLEGGDYFLCNTITFGEDGRVERVKLSGEHVWQSGTGSVTCDEHYHIVKHRNFSVGILRAQCKVYHVTYK